MYCYCIENQNTQKMYIGITSNSIGYRMKQHQYNIDYGKKTYFYDSVRKHGKCKFIFKFIKDYTNQCSFDELKEIEKYYIMKYKTYIGFKNSKGYNQTLGGDGGITVLPNKICQQNINACINKTQRTSGGFIWRFKNDL